MWDEFEVVEYDPRTAEDLNSRSGEAEAENATVEKKKQDANDRFTLPILAPPSAISGDSPAPPLELKKANITDENGVMTSDMFEGMYYGPVDLTLSADEAEAVEKKRQEEFEKIDARVPIKTA